MKLYLLGASCLLTLLIAVATASENHHEHSSEHHEEHHHGSEHRHNNKHDSKHDHDELEFTEHQAHEHGHARATISYSNNNVVMSITLPSIDVFGFEHEPHNKEEQAIVEQALKKISILDNIVSIDPVCKADTYSVSNNLSSSHDDAHSDVQINATLSCDNNKPRLITFTLFETLSTVEELSVEYISDNIQNLHTLSPNERTFTTN